LKPCIAASAVDPRTLLRLLLLERLVGGLSHPDGIQRLCLIGLKLNILKLQLIVVIPDACTPIVEVLSLQLALPPLFCLWIAEVDEGSLAAPEKLLIGLATLVLDEVPLFFQLCIPRMAGQDSRLYVHAQIIPTLGKRGEKRLVVGKFLLVPKKRISLALGTFQIARGDIHAFTRNPVFFDGGKVVQDSLFCIIRLGIVHGRTEEPEAEQRREGGKAGYLEVVLQHLVVRATHESEVTVWTALHLHGEEERTLPAQVEKLDQALVEEQAAQGSCLGIALDHKRNRLIERIGIGSIITERITVVHGEPSSSSVGQPALIPEAVELIRL